MSDGEAIVVLLLCCCCSSIAVIAAGSLYACSDGTFDVKKFDIKSCKIPGRKPPDPNAGKSEIQISMENELKFKEDEKKRLIAMPPSDVDTAPGVIPGFTIVDDPSWVNLGPNECWELAKKSEDKGVIGWGHRNDKHANEKLRNTCFLYKRNKDGKDLNPFKGDPKDTTTISGCPVSGAKLTDGCLTVDQLEAKREAEAEKKRLAKEKAAEEAEKKRAAQEAAKEKAAEEAERRREAQEAARERAAEEAEKKRLAQEAAKEKAAEEAERRREAEEARREAQQTKLEAQQAIREAEAERRREAQEAAKEKAAEEAERRREAEEARREAEAERRREAQEAAKERAAEDAERRREAEEARREAERERQELEAERRRDAEEAARERAAEDAERRRDAEQARREAAAACFSPKTPVVLENGTRVAMSELKLGDVLVGGIVVKATLRIRNINDVYYKIFSEELNDYVYVTGTHYIQHEDTFIHVSQHPGAQRTDELESVLTCLVTNTHIIPVGEYSFWDWEDNLIPQ